jgi:tRNA G18 (ribose-2'-O)-methylase SpoU
MTSKSGEKSRLKEQKKAIAGNLKQALSMRKLTMDELGRPSVAEAASRPRIPVVVVLDNVRSLNNVGSFFRTCDAFAVARLILCGITGTPPDREIHKTALGAELTVPWQHHADTTVALESLRNEGFTLLAVEQVAGATMLDKFTVDSSRKYALVFGNEVDGVSQSAVDMCDGAIEIPQSGAKHSLNVAVSGGIVLWPFFCNTQNNLVRAARAVTLGSPSRHCEERSNPAV